MSQVNRYLDATLVEHLNQMELSARSVVQGAKSGQHRSPVRGASVEFRQHRFYVHGDEPRRLDWRVLGRTDRPYVKEYEEETNLRCALLLDRSASMGYGGDEGTKFDYGARLAAALGYLMLAQTETVGLAICGDGVEQWLPPRSGPAQLSRLLESLDHSSPSGSTGIAKAMNEIAERLERRGLVIVLSDFFAPIDQLRSGLAHLRHQRHEVIAMQIVAPDENQFPFRNWTRFKGLEGEGVRLCEPAIVRQIYQENFNRHRKGLEEAALALRVEFGVFVTDRTILESIRTFLARRRVG